MAEFRMPALGSDMEDGTLVEWLKHPGDAVKRGDIIAIVDTQKGAIEIEVFEDGVFEKTVVEAGHKVPVGAVLAFIRRSGVESGRDKPAAQAPSPATAEPPATTPHPAQVLAPRTLEPTMMAQPLPARAGHQRVSPLARRLAADLGVDLSAVTGTGEQGAITRADVEHAAVAARTSVAAAAVTKAPVVASGASGATTTSRRAGMRSAIAAAMTRAKREIPHYYLSTTVDVGKAMRWLRDENERRPMSDRLLPAALLIKAVARALHDVPELNGYWVDGGFRQGAGIHAGVAISLRGGGLIAPAIHDADTLDLTTLMRHLRDLVARARAGSLRSSELSDATVTITNLGELGVESAFGIIYPPQVALVGFGTISERPWVADGKVEARPLVTVTLSADHRATDGHRGGVFLAAVDRWIQSPERL